MRKKILALLLAIVMVVSVLPGAALAEEAPTLAAGKPSSSDLIGYWKNTEKGIELNLSHYNGTYNGDIDLYGGLRVTGGGKYECNAYLNEYLELEFYMYDESGENGMDYSVALSGNTLTLTEEYAYGTVDSALYGTVVLTKDTTVDTGAAGKIERQDFTAVKEDNGDWTLTLNGTLGENEAWAYIAGTNAESFMAPYLFQEMNNYLFTSTAVLDNTSAVEEYIDGATLTDMSTSSNVFTINGSYGVCAIFAAKVETTRIDSCGNKYMLHTVGGALIEGTDTFAENELIDAVTVDIDWGGHGAGKLPAQLELPINSSISDQDLPIEEEGYTLIGFMDNYSGSLLPLPITATFTMDASLTALWLPEHPTIELTWKDSMGTTIPGAPTSYTFDLTPLVAAFEKAIDKRDSDYLMEGEYQIAMAMLKAVREYNISSCWDLSDGDSLDEEEEDLDELLMVVIDDLIFNPTGSHSYTLQCSEGYDTAIVNLFFLSPVLDGGFEARYAYLGYFDPSYELAFETLKSKMSDAATAENYLPAALFDSFGGIICTVRTVEELESALTELGEYFYEWDVDDWGEPIVSVQKYEELAVDLMWLDTDETVLSDKLYPSNYIVPDTDYYAARTNDERNAALDAMRQDFNSKLGTALSWDGGYGTWDVGAYDGSFEALYQKMTADEIFDILRDCPPAIALRRHEDAFAFMWDAYNPTYTISNFYENGTSEIDLDQWRDQYTTDLESNAGLATYVDGEKLRVNYTYIDNKARLGVRTEHEFISDKASLLAMLDSLPQRCREDGLCGVEVMEYGGTGVALSWYDKYGDPINGLPTKYMLDLSKGASECGEEFYNQYGEILDNYVRFADLYSYVEVSGKRLKREYYDDPFKCCITNAADVMAYIATEANTSGTVNFRFYEYDGNYTFQGDTAYRIGIGEYYEMAGKTTIDMWGYYNYRWMTTTYDNDGYCLETSDLGNAAVDYKVTVVNGKNLMLSFTVTADEAIKDGKLGLWADVMVGDNDAATVRTVFDEKGNKIGFDLIDDGWHYDEEDYDYMAFNKCSTYNGRYTCYVAGEELVDAAKKILRISDPVEGQTWYGNYDYASEYWFEELDESNAYADYYGYYNDDYTALYQTDSGAAVHWDVNLAAGESQTYCVSFGVVDASMNVAPRFIGNLPQFGEEGFVTVDVANLIVDGSSGHNIILLLDTTKGDQLDAGKATLYSDPAKLFTVDPVTQIKNRNITAVSDLFTGKDDQYNEYDQVAQFIVSMVNAYPDTYVITGMTAINDGGETAEYVLSEHGIKNFTMIIPATPRTRPLFLSDPEKIEETENLKEGWSFDTNENELTVHSLDITTGSGHEEEAALDLPAGADIAVESFEKDGKPGENKINSAGDGIEFAEGGSDESVISGDGKLSVTAEKTGIVAGGDLVVEAETTIDAKNGIESNGDVEIGGKLTVTAEETGITSSGSLDVKGETTIDAETGIDSDGDVVISGEIEIDASKLGIACETLKIEKGGTLTINIEPGASLLDVNNLVIPDGYEIVGGKLENGEFVPNEGATQLIIRKKTTLPVYSGGDDEKKEPKKEEPQQEIDDMPFVDVPASAYFYDAVKWAADNGITQGTDAKHFSPALPVTRAQVVTFLWRAAGSPAPKDGANPFIDVFADKYYATAVAWAIEEGITKGTSATTFSPDATCTRGQIVTFLARFAGVQDAETESVFEDVKPTDYFAAAVKWAKDNDVTNGTSATTFSADNACTRGEVVTFLYRWLVREEENS